MHPIPTSPSFSTMISVSEAENLILQNGHKVLPNSLMQVPLSLSCGHHLGEDIRARRNAPPFHRVCMDGVAISMQAWNQGQRSFPLEGVQAAGRSALTLGHSLHGIEVMTGAPLPWGCDGVIPYEQIEINEKMAIIKDEVKAFQKMQNVQPEGQEHRQGDLLLSKGTLLRSPQIGVISSQGMGDVLIHQRPSIAVISTGDELVDFHQIPQPFQIWRSNPWAIKAELESWGQKQQDIELFHLPDEEMIIREKLSLIMQKFPLLIISGGVSKGKFDFIPQVLKDLEVETVFYQVRQRPGLPLWFGTTALHLIFGLPGNPCSSLMTLRRYVIPLLRPKASTSYSWALLEEDFSFAKPLTFFLPVTLRKDEKGDVWAKPRPTQGSGDFGALGGSDGFLELEENRDRFLKGERFKLFTWGGM